MILINKLIKFLIVISLVNKVFSDVCLKDNDTVPSACTCEDEILKCIKDESETVFRLNSDTSAEITCSNTKPADFKEFLTGFDARQEITNLTLHSCNDVRLLREDFQSLNRVKLCNVHTHPKINVSAILHEHENLDLTLEDVEIDVIPNSLKLRSLNLIRNNLTSLDTIRPQGLILLTSDGNFNDTLSKLSVEALSSLEEIELLNSSIAEIEEDALEHLTNLRALHIESVYLESLPNSNSVQESAIFVNAKKTLKTIRPNLFKSTKMNDIKLSVGLSEIPVTAFDNVPNLINLDLSDNGLSAIPEKLFHNLTLLVHLSLSCNNLNIISENTFKFNTNLESISLDYNKIKNIKQDIFTELKNLKTLNMSNNYLSAIFDLPQKDLIINFSNNNMRYVTCTKATKGSATIFFSSTDQLLMDQKQSANICDRASIDKNGIHAILPLCHQKCTCTKTTKKEIICKDISEFPYIVNDEKATKILITFKGVGLKVLEPFGEELALNKIKTIIAKNNTIERIIFDRPLPKLEKLYLARNSIESIDNPTLETLNKMGSALTVDLKYNPINLTALEGVKFSLKTTDDDTKSTTEDETEDTTDKPEKSNRKRTLIIVIAFLVGGLVLLVLGVFGYSKFCSKK